MSETEEPANPPNQQTEGHSEASQGTKINSSTGAETISGGTTDNSGSSSGSSATSATAAKTADETPMDQYILLLFLALAIFAASMFFRERSYER